MCIIKVACILLINVYFNYIDINECAVNDGGCEHDCTNHDGSYYCDCSPGYSLGEDKHSCLGIHFNPS